jgi:hypothetical protein
MTPLMNASVVMFYIDRSIFVKLVFWLGLVGIHVVWLEWNCYMCLFL